MDHVGPGTLLGGRYLLGSRLDPAGEATDTERWAASDETLARPVVCLLVPERLPTAAAALDAARRAAGVEDRRLVRVLDVVHAAGVVAVVEESLVGALSLEDALAGGPIPAEEARRIVGETATALARAEARGLHHLVLSPHAVLVLPDGSVKVRGLAIEAAVRGVDDTVDAPARADVEGLTALLYAALTGRWPGPERPGQASRAEAAPRVGGRLVAPSELVAGVTPDLDRLVETVLAPAETSRRTGPIPLGGRRSEPRTPAEFAASIAPWSSLPLIDLAHRLRTPAADDSPGMPRDELPPTRAVEGAPAPTGQVRSTGAVRTTPAGSPGTEGPATVGAAAGAAGGATAAAAALTTVADEVPRSGIAASGAATSGGYRAGVAVASAAKGVVGAARTTTERIAARRRERAAELERARAELAAQAPQAPSEDPVELPAASAGSDPTESGQSAAAAVAATSATPAPPAPVRPAPVPPTRPAPVPPPARHTAARSATLTDRRLSDVLVETDERLEAPAPLLPPAVRRTERPDSRLPLALVALAVVVLGVLGWKGLPSFSGLAGLGAAPTPKKSTSAPAKPGASQAATTGQLAKVAIVGGASLETDRGQVGSAYAARAWDGKPETFWRSNKYYGSASFGNTGTTWYGLIADLGQETTVRQVIVTVPAAQDFTVYVGSKASLDGATKIGASSGQAGAITVDVPAGTTATGNLVIVQFTKLAPDPEAGGRFRALVSELEVRK